MNKFEKKALAKRAYRALVKTGGGRDVSPMDYQPPTSAAPTHGVMTAIGDGPWTPRGYSPAVPTSVKNQWDAEDEKVRSQYTPYQRFLASSYGSTRDALTDLNRAGRHAAQALPRFAGDFAANPQGTLFREGLALGRKFLPQKTNTSYGTPIESVPALKRPSSMPDPTTLQKYEDAMRSFNQNRNLFDSLKDRP